MLIPGYIGESLFFVAHLYPTLRWLIPSYVLLGLCLGPLACARSTFVATLASKLTYVLSEEEELQETLHGDIRETLLRKLTRGLQVKHHTAMMETLLYLLLFFDYCFVLKCTGQLFYYWQLVNYLSFW